MASIEDRRAAMRERVDHWARTLNVPVPKVRVRHMTRKWGSCSTSGTITLAYDLADQKPDFQDLVIAHELLHLRVPNHGRLFKALLNTYVPNLSSRPHEIQGPRNDENAHNLPL